MHKEPPQPKDYCSVTPWRYQEQLFPVIADLLASVPTGGKILDAGCGNGFFSGKLLERGFRVIGIDISESGIALCKAHYPAGEFHVGSISDPDLPSKVGTGYDAILAAEVMEHLYSPAAFIANCRILLHDEGRLVITTPHHGYLKNLAMALVGRLDTHFQPGQEGGHIKFWSARTLAAFLLEHGFEVTRSRGIGLLPFLWKSMAVQAIKTA